VDAGGHLVAGCSTSGLRFKHPGRVGDTPIVGSGLYADDRAGAAAATGDGDHIQKYCMSFLVVELMRAGASPMDACREVLHRYLESHTDPPTREISLIALSPEGEFGAGTLMKSFPYGVWTPSGAEERAEAPCDQP
jgi:isoaspartyl peptidase/L-asparaginase-like protein (Ntn-hydrolase superfamily)